MLYARGSVSFALSKPSMRASRSSLRGLAAMAAGRGTHAAIVRGRLIVADGVVSALGYKTAATLLKTIELQTWTAIGLFAAILTLRTLVKRVLVWEEARLRRA